MPARPPIVDVRPNNRLECVRFAHRTASPLRGSAAAQPKRTLSLGEQPWTP